ncbi:hypothetical protein Pcinc_025476 [Petrolisthes cinctipes]|uniref:Peptidase M14 domain-containing protein n=1 Tax=Petrolisthes cinctipes TaxID=88211 RepID=A0AAE1F8R2_PETCI|nr:hypothetical protein Pcinc_025476 [Petrolisthes cinctipes]
MWCVGHWLVVVAAVVVATVAALPANIPENLQPLIGHQVWEVSSERGEAVLWNLVTEGHIDVLDHSGTTRKFRVAGKDADKVAGTLRTANLTHSVLIRDLALFLKEEEGPVERRADISRSCTTTSCPVPSKDAYMTFKEIEYYLKHIGNNNPRVELRSLGKSHEGRDIWLVHIKPVTSKRVGARIAFSHMRKRAIWIEGGIHARERISPAVTLLLIDHFLNDFPQDKPFDIYIVPMANPDGYVYTWTNDRLWRKNRRNNAGSCEGVDLNRNWDAHWGVGASTQTCSEVYRGPSPFSEPETKVLSEEMTRLNNQLNFDLVLSIHNYGQVLLYPYGWTTNPAPHTEDMKKKGNVFLKAAKAHAGTVYTMVNTAGGFYYAAGATDDWAKEKLGTRYVYTLELRDKGRYGFTLPANQILSTATEVWQGLDMMINAIAPEKTARPN